MLSRKLAGDRAYYGDHDKELRAELRQRLAPQADYLDEILANFPIYTRRVDMARFLGKYELFRDAVQVPGYFVEIGVYKGEGLLTWAKLLDMHCPADRLRRVIGFDNFAGFTSLHDKDGPLAPQADKIVGGWNPAGAKDDLEFFISLFQHDRFLPHASLIELVEGDVCATAKAYAQANPGLRIALLNLDVDLYEPTLAALEALYPLVSPGGVVVIDEYGVKHWPGPSLAVRDYFGGKMPRLRKSTLTTTPGAYFIKE